MNKLFRQVVSLCLVQLVLLTFAAQPILAAVNYAYDANGNMTSDGEKCFSYNDANQLSKVTYCSSGQTIEEYVYDYQGKRLLKKEYENGVLKQTIYSPDKEYETKKLADGSTQNTSYYFANNELLAKKNSDGNKEYYQNDHLSSTSLLTNQTGTKVEETTYYPYGEVKSGGTNSKYQFTGQEKDSTGLNYYGARYYNSHIQRFTQPDLTLPNTYDPQQLNRYSYVRNNPLRYTDPSGKVFFIPPALFMGAVALSTWANAYVSSPEFQVDLKDWSDSLSYAQNPNNGNDRFLPLVVSGVSTALPIFSGGGQATKALLSKSNKATDIVSSAAKVHNNSIKTQAPAALYTLRSLASDAIFKIGETTMAKRYTDKFLTENGLYLQMEAFGTKREMREIENYLLKEFTSMGQLPLLGNFEKHITKTTELLLPYLNKSKH